MFAPATRRQLKARILLVGPTGGGKTYTALRLATTLAKGGRIAYIDTESRSAEKYAGEANPDGGAFAFDVLNLAPDQHAPEDFMRAIDGAERGGYDVIVIDSISHAWAGVLSEIDKKAKGKENSFTAWRDVTPRHNEMVGRMIGSRAHLICCVRSKMEYVMEPDSKGKMVPRRVGMAPVFRDGIEYEFDIALEAQEPGTFNVTKTRAVALFDKSFTKPGEMLGRAILEWLENGSAPAPDAPRAPSPVPDGPAPDEDIEPHASWKGNQGRFFADLKRLGLDYYAEVKPLCMGWSDGRVPKQLPGPDLGRFMQWLAGEAGQAELAKLRDAARVSA